ncbi:MAG: hypothetical protein S0880_07345 [Actinomycetota bacterium]|nr:hypothetical protein [Actinomycetota bacterium]
MTAAGDIAARGVDDDRLRGDAGSGLFSSALGFLVVMILMLFATQLAFHLLTTSRVTHAAGDAARVAARSATVSGVPSAAGVDRAEERLREVLGDDITVDWSGTDGDAVHLRVRANAPVLLPASFRDVLGMGVVDRTVVVRTETLR